MALSVVLLIPLLLNFQVNGSVLKFVEKELNQGEKFVEKELNDGGKALKKMKKSKLVHEMENSVSSKADQAKKMSGTLLKESKKKIKKEAKLLEDPAERKKLWDVAKQKLKSDSKQASDPPFKDLMDKHHPNCPSMSKLVPVDVFDVAGVQNCTKKARGRFEATARLKTSDSRKILARVLLCPVENVPVELADGSKGRVYLLDSKGGHEAILYRPDEQLLAQLYNLEPGQGDSAATADLDEQSALIKLPTDAKCPGDYTVVSSRLSKVSVHDMDDNFVSNKNDDFDAYFEEEPRKSQWPHPAITVVIGIMVIIIILQCFVIAGTSPKGKSRTRFSKSRNSSVTQQKQTLVAGNSL